MGSCLSLTQPIILPESTLPRKLTEQEEQEEKEIEIWMEKFADEIKLEEEERVQQEEKEIEIWMEKFADEIKLEEEERVQQTLRTLNTI